MRGLIGWGWIGGFRGIIAMALISAGTTVAGSRHGGLLDGGPLGRYFANPELAGAPSFERRDVRVDFEWPAGTPPGGSRSPGFAGVGADGFAVRWEGRLSPRVGGTHRLVVDADDGARLGFRREGESAFRTVLDAWAASGRHEAPVELEAGARYEVRLEYRQDSGPARVRFRWSGPGFDEETLDVASMAALNVETYADEIWANAMDGARDEWRDPGFGEDRNLWPRRDADGWPLGDAAVVVWEGAEAASVAGTYRLRFEGRARVSAQGNAAEFLVDGRSVGSFLPAGAGWDEASNTTTAEVRIPALDILYLAFAETRRVASDPVGTGVRKVFLERPTAVGGSLPHVPGSRFDLRAKRAFSRYAGLRWISNFETERAWSDRVKPSYSTHRDTGTLRHWELMVQLANETGKDLHACLPHRADDDYVRKVARLLRFGSDGVEPYDGPRADPVFPPLNPNLRAYLERGNEIWNFSFSQGPENAEDARREVLLATANGRILDFDGTNPNGDAFYRWHALRSLQMSRIVRSVWGDEAMGDRIRFLLEYQYDNFQGTAESAFDFLDRYFDNADGEGHVPDPHPVRRDFWGGGGAVYYGSGNAQGVQTETPVADGGLEEPALASDEPAPMPAASGWQARGTAGIYRRRSASPAVEVVSVGSVRPAPDTRRLQGMRFTTGDQPLAVHELGRWIPHGPKREHDLWLLRAADRSVVAYLRAWEDRDIDGGFLVGRVDVPVLLEPRTSYLLLSSEEPFGDGFPDVDTVLGTGFGIRIETAVSAEYGDPEWDPTSWTLREVGGAGTSLGALHLGVVSAAAPSVAGFPPDPPEGMQAMWLAGTSSVSRVVRFARPGTYALRFQAAARADRETGLFFEVDGRNATPRGASHEGPVTDHWVPGIGFGRDARRFENNGSFVFDVPEAGDHVLRITSSGYSRYYNPFDVQVDPDRAVYLDAIEVVSVDALFGGGIPAGGEANGQPSEQTGAHAATVSSQARYAQAYGLEVLAYEGGWSLGGDFGAVPIQNWAKFRDPRAQASAVDSMDFFARSGGAVYTWGTYTTWPKGAMETASDFPLTRGVDDFGSRLPPEPSNGIHVPSTLRPSSAKWGLNASTSTGRLSGPGGWLGWNLLVAEAGEFGIAVDTGGSGTYRLLVDGSEVARGLPAGTVFRRIQRWTRGLHHLRVQSLSGEPELRGVEVVRDGVPSAPTAVTVADGDGRLEFRWTPPVSGPVPTGYRVLVGTAAGDFRRSVEAGPETRCVVDGLPNGVPHFAVVVAFNGTGSGPTSEELVGVPFADGDRATLVAFEFAGGTGNEISRNPTAQSSRVLAGSILRGPGLKPTTYLQIAAGTFGSEAAGDRYAQDAAESVRAGQYYEWTVAPAAGRTLAAETLRFRPYFQNVTGQAGDPRGAVVRVAADRGDFATVPAVGTPTFDGRTEFVADLSGVPSMTALLATLTVRIHLFGNGPFEFTGLGGPGMDLVLEGRVSAPATVPVPALTVARDGDAVVVEFVPRPGRMEVLERSADLRTWSPTETVSMPSGTQRRREVPAGTPSFFRLVP